MDYAQWQAERRARRAPVINICPNALLGLASLTSLVFVSHLGRNGVLIFLLTGMLLLARRLDLTLREVRDYWWVWLFPLWCILSVLWSDHPHLSLRHGVQLLVTFMVAVTLARRLSPIVFLRILFIALATAGIASLLIGKTRADGIWIGIFDSKNYYAFTMVALTLCSFALTMDPKQDKAWRLAGLAGVLMGIPQIIMAESAGAAIASLFVLAVALVIIHSHKLPPARRTQRMKWLAILAFVGVLGALAMSDMILNFVFEVTGKDPSLTGRTDLWMVALDQIARSPFLGSGYSAFWVEGNATAEAIWAEFHIGSKSGFNFHNLYLSNAVETGLIGVLLQLSLLAPAFVFCIRWLLHASGAPAMFCFMALCFVLVLSLVEVPVFSEFHALSVMTLASLVYGLRAARELPQLRPAKRTPHTQRTATI